MVNVNGNSDVKIIEDLSLDDMVGKYRANERFDSVELKRIFKNRR